MQTLARTTLAVGAALLLGSATPAFSQHRAPAGVVNLHAGLTVSGEAGRARLQLRPRAPGPTAVRWALIGAGIGAAVGVVTAIMLTAPIEGAADDSMDPLVFMVHVPLGALLGFGIGGLAGLIREN